MALDEGLVHRPGALKQQNKGHKHGKHRSKGSIDTINKGRVPVKVQSKRKRQELRREERRHQAKRSRQNKREEVLAQKRRLGGSRDAPPHLVVIFGMSGDSKDLKKVLELLQESHPEALSTISSCGIVHLSVPQLKRRFAFILPQAGNLWATLDVCKVAHSILLVTHAEEQPNDLALQLLSCITAQWLPSCVLAVRGMSNLPPKKKSEVKKNITKNLERFFPVEKIVPLDSAMDGQLVLRQLSLQKQPEISQRDCRSQMLAEKIEFLPHAHDASRGTLKVSGYILGRTLSVNSLVYVPGWGEFQLERTELLPDPHPLKGSIEGEEAQLLEEADPNLQESLQKEADVKEYEEEQALGSDNEAESRPTNLRKVPKGTSRYQAAWISSSESEMDDDEESNDSMQTDDGNQIGAMVEDDAEINSADDNDEKEEEDAEINSADDDDEKEEDDNISVSATTDGNPERYNAKVDTHEEEETFRKIREAREDAMFPDEVDTPQNMAASVRFQKYRGLQSFRTSAWDPKESLPHDYARVFRFHHFRSTAKRIMQEESTGALPGWYVSLHLKDVPTTMGTLWSCSKSPFVLVGLLPYEQKMSVLNLVLRRRPGEDQEPIGSKERLLFHVGHRRFYACPIFSQHSLGNKQKFERFFQPDSTCVATLYAPIVFPPASVLVFKLRSDGSQQLVATGSLLSVNTDRVIVKRAVLSGHPYKIHRRTSVIRYMFFTPEDVRWFKPVQLNTKLGRRGHIQEPLGTHGHMKCVFNGQLKSEDTVLMSLYKRVFPKWTFDPYVPQDQCLLYEK